MSWLDGSVIGGQHHGERFPVERRRTGDLYRAPILEVMPPELIHDRPFIEHVMAQAYLGEYRLCNARCGSNSFRFWIPASVRNDDELGHVLNVALHGSIF